MRIGYFGGSFDPPHVGHLAMARAAAAAFSLDRILFVPTAHQPLKPNGAAASFDDRFAMTKLLCDQDAAFEVALLEEARADGAPNYTIDTLQRLRSTLTEEDSLFVLVGADAFLGLRQWREPDELLRAAEWIVVSRPGFSLADLAPLGLSAEQRSRVHLLEGLNEPTSATGIRELLAQGDNCAAFLPPDVVDYIRSRQLYSA